MVQAIFICSNVYETSNSLLLQSETRFKPNLLGFYQLHVTTSGSTKGLRVYTYMLLVYNYSNLIMLQGCHLCLTAITSTSVVVQ
jgi:hypothetical protein